MFSLRIALVAAFFAIIATRQEAQAFNCGCKWVPYPPFRLCHPIPCRKNSDDHRSNKRQTIEKENIYRLQIDNNCSFTVWTAVGLEDKGTMITYWIKLDRYRKKSLYMSSRNLYFHFDNKKVDYYWDEYYRRGRTLAVYRDDDDGVMQINRQSGRPMNISSREKKIEFLRFGEWYLRYDDDRLRICD